MFSPSRSPSVQMTRLWQPRASRSNVLYNRNTPLYNRNTPLHAMITDCAQITIQFYWNEDLLIYYLYFRVVFWTHLLHWCIKQSSWVAPIPGNLLWWLSSFLYKNDNLNHRYCTNNDSSCLARFDPPSFQIMRPILEIIIDSIDVWVMVWKQLRSTVNPETIPVH